MWRLLLSVMTSNQIRFYNFQLSFIYRHDLQCDFFINIIYHYYIKLRRGSLYIQEL